MPEEVRKPDKKESVSVSAVTDYNITPVIVYPVTGVFYSGSMTVPYFSHPDTLWYRELTLSRHLAAVLLFCNNHLNLQIVRFFTFQDILAD